MSKVKNKKLLTLVAASISLIPNPLKGGSPIALEAKPSFLLSQKEKKKTSSDHLLPSQKIALEKAKKELNEQKVYLVISKEGEKKTTKDGFCAFFPPINDSLEKPWLKKRFV